MLFLPNTSLFCRDINIMTYLILQLRLVAVMILEELPGIPSVIIDVGFASLVLYKYTDLCVWVPLDFAFWTSFPWSPFYTGWQLLLQQWVFYSLFLLNMSVGCSMCSPIDANRIWQCGNVYKIVYWVYFFIFFS